MRPIIATVVVLLLAIGFVLFLRLNSFFGGASAQAHEMASAFRPDPKNKTVLDVHGWHESEVHKILSDFRQMYGLPTESNLRITREADDQFSIRFPEDIEPKILYFLVNYIRYPRGFDLKQREISVAGYVSLSSAFGIPDPALAGKRAIIFVPQNDHEYDFVCARLEDGRTYKIPFVDLIWQPAENMMMPAKIRPF